MSLPEEQAKIGAAPYKGGKREKQWQEKEEKRASVELRLFSPRASLFVLFGWLLVRTAVAEVLVCLSPFHRLLLYLQLRKKKVVVVVVFVLLDCGGCRRRGGNRLGRSSSCLPFLSLSPFHNRSGL
jgi:hypothetical protein